MPHSKDATLYDAISSCYPNGSKVILVTEVQNLQLDLQWQAASIIPRFVCCICTAHSTNQIQFEIGQGFKKCFGGAEYYILMQWMLLTGGATQM